MLILGKFTHYSPVKLSIIIVNYNVKHFLEQCLHSVYNAIRNIEAEVFVVDNNSVDGSIALVKEKFPHVILIENKENLGFSKANNQALKLTKGKYCLLLNPDTVVQEDTFEKCIRFMDEHEDAGGLGVKMLDGKGNFLPESKRGLPTPEVAFYKIFGLSKLFPGSKKFGQYHLTYLANDKTHQVDVLSGAFMLIRKETLDKIGLLDETFFMYGEDIDLSYRITKGGYKNYYFPETTIIHYKGESTKKSSVNYVFVFYRAMIIFAEKHFSSKHARTFSFLINLAIYLRAAMAISARFVKQMAIPALDFGGLLGGMFGIKYYYEHFVKFTEGGAYSEKLVYIALPVYCLCWMFTVFISGGYDIGPRPVKILRGIAAGTGLILIGYSLLPESYRFSRAIILIGMLWAVIWYLLSRLLLQLSGNKNYSLIEEKSKRIAIIGDIEEFQRVYNLLKETNIKAGFIGWINVNEQAHTENLNLIGQAHQTEEVIHIYEINEIIFCAKNLSSGDIIRNMSELMQAGVDFKIAPPESLSIIGSNSIDTAGDLYMIDFNSISKPHNRRKKRILDLASSTMLILFSPVLVWFQNNPFRFISNCFLVLIGLETWVGFGNSKSPALPRLKKSVLQPGMLQGKIELNEEQQTRVNLLYSKDYLLEKDLKIIFRNFRFLGN